MKKILKTIGIVITLGSLILSVGCGKTNSSVTAQSSQNNNEKEETKIKLNKENAININYDNDDYKNILHLFTQNKEQAKNKYLNKTLKITGEVQKVEKNDGSIIVNLMTKDDLYGAILEFEDTKENENKILNLKTYDDSKGYYKTVRGDVITAYGYFKEYKDGQYVSDGDRINLTNCELI